MKNILHVLTILVLSGCVHNSIPHFDNDKSEAYVQHIKRFPVSPEKAISIAKLESKRRDELGLESCWFFAEPSGIYGDYYAILRPQKVGIIFNGFYVHAYTGQVHYIPWDEREYPPVQLLDMREESTSEAKH